jgi:hypothetical protein
MPGPSIITNPAVAGSKVAEVGALSMRLPFAPTKTPLLGHCEALAHVEQVNTSVTPAVVGIEVGVVVSDSVPFFTRSSAAVLPWLGQFDALQSKM